MAYEVSPNGFVEYSYPFFSSFPYTIFMLNQRTRRTPLALPVLYAEDARVGARVRLLFSTPERIQPTVSLLERHPGNLWRVGFDNGDTEIVHSSLLASLPIS